MSITEFSVMPVGARVRVRRGRYPVDPDLVGRDGVIVANSHYYPHKVEVTLDGEQVIRTFAPTELEVVETAPQLPRDQSEARKRLARP